MLKSLNNIIKITFIFVLLHSFLIDSIYGQIELDYCNYKQFGFDSTTNNYTIRTSLYPFVKFYPLKTTIKNAYLTPEIQLGLSKIDKRAFLNMSINFVTQNVIKKYGIIKKKSQLVIHFLTGGNIVLLCVRDCHGKRTDEDSILYNPNYFIPHEHIKDLEQNDIDYISIQWSNQADTYETFQVDLLRNLFDCINK